LNVITNPIPAVLFFTGINDSVSCLEKLSRPQNIRKTFWLKLSPFSGMA